jgi:hypothetical protein
VGCTWRWKLARRREPSSRVLGSDEFRVLPILEQIDASMLTRLQVQWSVSTNELLLALAAAAIVRYERRHGRASASLRMLSPMVCDARLLEQPEWMVECLDDALADAIRCEATTT